MLDQLRQGGIVIVFSSGQISKRTGAMATLKGEDAVRQNSDLEKNKAGLSKASFAFFDGIFEQLIQKTGGWLLWGESWNDSNISQTVIKNFSSIVDGSGSDVSLSIVATPNF
jgi:hypothetical protein